MLAEGTDAPTITLPGLVDGAHRTVDIEEYIGDSILVLAFYPADFNPACEDDTCDLTAFDLLTMQNDVDIFAISPDSVFSHRTFAEEYSLSMPLLADTHGEAVDAYDVRLEASDQLLAQRAAFVIDQRGVIQYAWSTTDLDERFDVDAVREAISNIGGDSTAVGRYRVGHAHYMEGRRAFTSAMNSYEDRDWLIAQGDFERAMDEFQESAEQFQSAVRFAESAPLGEGFERANEKATALWQAAEWLADSANEYSSGNGREADNYREDAEAPLQTARDIGEPPDPDDIRIDAEAAAEAADDDDAGNLQAPTDPAEDETTSEPGGDTDSESRDDDVDAALEDIETDAGVADNDTESTASHADGAAVSDAVEADVSEHTDSNDDAAVSLDDDDDATASTDDDDDATVPADDDDEDDEDIELDLTDPNE